MRYFFCGITSHTRKIFSIGIFLGAAFFSCTVGSADASDAMVHSFSASPMNVTSGATTTLSWTTGPDASECFLTGGQWGGKDTDTSGFSVSCGQGSVTTAPLNQNTGYAMHAALVDQAHNSKSINYQTITVVVGTATGVAKCGSANGAVLPATGFTEKQNGEQSDFGWKEHCAQGIPSSLYGLKPGVSLRWTCYGEPGHNGTYDVDCSTSRAELPPPPGPSIDGVCGFYDKTTNMLDADATSHLGLDHNGSGACSHGTFSNLVGTGPWKWDCAGKEGGKTAHCSASPNPHMCGTWNGSEQLTPPSFWTDSSNSGGGAACFSGTVKNRSGDATSGPWKWDCANTDGSLVDHCSVTRSTPTPGDGKGVCGPAAKTYAAHDTSFSGALCASGTLAAAASGGSVTGNPPPFPAQCLTSSWACVGPGTTGSAFCGASRVGASDGKSELNFSGKVPDKRDIDGKTLEITSFSVVPNPLPIDDTGSTGRANLQWEITNSITSIDDGPTSLKCSLSGMGFWRTEVSCGSKSQRGRDITGRPIEGVKVNGSVELPPIEGAAGGAFEELQVVLLDQWGQQRTAVFVTLSAPKTNNSCNVTPPPTGASLPNPTVHANAEDTLKPGQPQEIIISSGGWGNYPANGGVRFAIDWDGNSTIDEYSTGTADNFVVDERNAAKISHTWTTAGTYHYQVKAVAKNGEESAWVPETIVISQSGGGAPMTADAVHSSSDFSEFLHQLYLKVSGGQ